MSWGNQGEWGVGGGTSGNTVIQQLDSDPSPAVTERAWVLKSITGGGAGAGEPYGLLLALTQPGVGAATTYQLSYRTLESTTVRQTLS